MNDKVAVIIGGGSGMGAAAARRLARDGYRVGVLSSSGKGEALGKGLGGIGFTDEHRLQYTTRRLWAWRDDFGSDAWWAAELGRTAIAARSTGFWPALSAKHFTALD